MSSLLEWQKSITSAGLTTAEVFTIELFLVILQTIQALKHVN